MMMMRMMMMMIMVGGMVMLVVVVLVMKMLMVGVMGMIWMPTHTLVHSGVPYLPYPCGHGLLTKPLPVVVWWSLGRAGVPGDHGPPRAPGPRCPRRKGTTASASLVMNKVRWAVV